jgi:hypothetical protein
MLQDDPRGPPIRFLADVGQNERLCLSLRFGYWRAELTPHQLV